MRMLGEFTDIIAERPLKTTREVFLGHFGPSLPRGVATDPPPYWPGFPCGKNPLVGPEYVVNSSPLPTDCSGCGFTRTLSLPPTPS